MANRTVIIIEDSQMVSRLMSKLFDRKRVVSLISDSIEDAVAAFDGRRVDAVFLDLVLPGVSGIEGMDLVKETWRACPVVAMTAVRRGDASAATLALAKARRAGADLILYKPFQEAEAFATLEDAFNLYTDGERAPRVLVVDDSRLARDMVEHALVEAGWRVWASDTMEHALERVDVLDVDVVITDIFMPGMGGIEGISQLRENWPGVNIVAMSGGLSEQMSSSETLEAAKRMGAFHVVQKPIVAEEIQRACREALEATSLDVVGNRVRPGGGRAA